MNKITEDEVMIIHHRLNKIVTIDEIPARIAVGLPSNHLFENIGFGMDRTVVLFHANEFISLDFSFRHVKIDSDVDFIIEMNRDKKIRQVGDPSFSYIGKYSNQEKQISFCQLYLKAVESESMYKLLNASLAHKNSIAKAKATRKKSIKI
ncbi:hypothetical protein [Burkholderia gladioli]|uniref:hypothetical protein n=1 Tax=Burkholderia gladioli TaxID=28095 RepID=UPI0016417A74|nr:hypothetical protein [Burkholderia gladioli]